MNNIIKKCLWCGIETKLDKTHIFPYVLGGRTWDYISCKKCNNYFGDHVESEILRNAIFTAAIKKLNLKNSQEAYRFAKKTDLSTGNPIVFNGDSAQVESHMVLENHFRANLKNLEIYIERQIKKLEKKFGRAVKTTKISDKITLYKIGDQTIRVTKHNKKESIVNIGGLTLYPDAELIVKIVLETASFLDVASKPIFKNFKKSFVEVEQSSKKNEILFARDELNKLFISTVNPEYDQIEKKEKYNYNPYHVITFWITSNDNLYAELSFFDALKCSLILGKISNGERNIIGAMCLYEYYFSWELPYIEVHLKSQSNYTDEEKEIIRYNNNIIDDALQLFDD